MGNKTTRRNFLKTASVSATALAMSAASYKRVAGANDRLSIAMIGCGERGRGAHMPGVNRYAKEENLEITVVCDPWRIAREAASEMTKDWYGREARQVVSYRDVMAMEDVDAVMIASCDHQHTTHLKAAAEAKKDVYVEKPLAMDLDRLKAACEAVRKNDVVCQIGTQLRSYPSMNGAKKVYESGILGKVGRIEQRRNGDRPYWYARLKDVKEKDVDWKEFLLDRPMRPFDPGVYSGWYGYREFSDGPLPGLGTHYIDLVHFITGAKFPLSTVCSGGTYTWIDEHKFDCPDQIEATWQYPEGFMVSYATNFGNGSGNTFRIFGKQGIIDLQNWNKPFLDDEGVRKPDGRIKRKTAIEPIERPDHMLDWLQCIRDRKKTPNANIEVGYSQSVACLMAMRAYDTGRRQTYDPKTQQIVEG